MDQAVHSALATRDAHLFGPGPKRILALDGGGVRGIVSLAFLARIERLLQARAGKAVLLGDYFDLIGGTSTGAIIASGLALGFTVAQIRDFYLRLAPRVFRPPWLRLPGWRAIFDAATLASELEGVIGARSLDSTDLRTGLGVTLKRIDAGSAWILINNPRSKFWETPEDRSFIGNRHYPLARIVRASTAAPHYFDPQEIQIIEGEPSAIFVDGGLTPHNNPAFALFLAATVPAYGLSWETGPEKLTIVSVGAGAYRDRVDARLLTHSSSLGLALRAMMQQIGESQQLILMLMSLIGESPTRWPINTEVGDLSAQRSPFSSLFRFLRYDIRLESDWLKQSLQVSLDDELVRRLTRLDDTRNMSLLEDLAIKAAETQVLSEHFAAG